MSTIDDSSATGADSPRQPMLDSFFAGEHYGATLFAALAALTPFLFAAGAGPFVHEQMAGSLGSDRASVAFIAHLATAAYATGAFLGGDLVRRFRQPQLFLGLQAIAALGWALSTIAGTLWPFAIGQVASATAAGALLAGSLPPALRQFPVARIPMSAFLINFGLFGAVAAGPLIGGVVHALDGWRWLYGVFAGLSLVVLAVAVRYMPRGTAKAPARAFDLTALLLTGSSTGLVFAAVGLTGFHDLLSITVLAPLALGLMLFAVLIAHEHRAEEPLAPIGPVLCTLALTGLLIATLGGGAFLTGNSTITELRLAGGATPLAAGLGFWPQFVGLLLAAVTFGLVIATRLFVPFLFVGMIATALALYLLLIADDPAGARVPLVLLGFGAGATVGPGLFLAALSLSPRLLGGVIALIELARAIGNFLPAPLLIDAAKHIEGSERLGIESAAWVLGVTLAIVVVGSLGVIAIYFAGRTSLAKVDLERWMHESKPALDSPPLFAKLRHHASDR